MLIIYYLTTKSYLREQICITNKRQLIISLWKCWKSPIKYQIKLNFDKTEKGNQGKAERWVGLLRDYKSNIIITYMEIKGKNTSSQQEAKALTDGIIKPD